jgi:hypothetical protein
MYGSFAFVGGYQWVFQLLRAIGAPAPPLRRCPRWPAGRTIAKLPARCCSIPRPRRCRRISAKQWAELAAIAFMPGKSPTFAFTCTGVALFLIAALLPS